MEGDLEDHKKVVLAQAGDDALKNTGGEGRLTTAWDMCKQRDTHDEDVEKNGEDILALVTKDRDVDVNNEQNLDGCVDGNDDVVARADGALDAICMGSS